MTEEPNHLVVKQLSRTKMCAMFSRGTCVEDNCRFAHSAQELRSAPDLSKTAMCRLYALGKCKDEKCKFAHGEEELRVTPSVYKTQLCNFFERGHCKKGDKCRHAHGKEQLRSFQEQGVQEPELEEKEEAHDEGEEGSDVEVPPGFDAQEAPANPKGRRRRRRRGKAVNPEVVEPEAVPNAASSTAKPSPDLKMSSTPPQSTQELQEFFQDSPVTRGAPGLTPVQPILTPEEKRWPPPMLPMFPMQIPEMPEGSTATPPLQTPPKSSGAPPLFTPPSVQIGSLPVGAGVQAESSPKKILPLPLRSSVDTPPVAGGLRVDPFNPFNMDPSIPLLPSCSPHDPALIASAAAYSSDPHGLISAAARASAAALQSSQEHSAAATAASLSAWTWANAAVQAGCKRGIDMKDYVNLLESLAAGHTQPPPATGTPPKGGCQQEPLTETPPAVPRRPHRRRAAGDAEAGCDNGKDPFMPGDENKWISYNENRDL